MSISKKSFGTTSKGEEVTLYTIENKNGMKAEFIDFGAILVNLYVADKDGKFDDVVLVKTSEPETVVEALNTYLKSDSVKLFKDGYGGEDNITAVQNAKVGNVGNYVYLVASTNSDKIETLILDSLK